MQRRRRSPALLLVAVLVASLLQVTSGAVAAQEVPASVVISQVYGGGGNSGATFTHDFVELFNAGDSAADVSGWSVQYTSAAGSGNWQVTPLGTDVTIPAGGYLLVQQAQGAGGTTPLPTPDATGTSPMSATNGKVALASTTTPLAGTGCPIADTTIDLVGFGSANCFEGAGAAPTLSNTTAAFRADAGCTDTDDNAADFTADAPAPRNSSTTPAPCGGSGEPVGPVPVISQVYGGGGNSGATFTHDFIELFNAGEAPRTSPVGRSSTPPPPAAATGRSPHSAPT